MPVSQVSPTALFVMLSALETTLGHTYCIENSSNIAVLRREEMEFANLQHFAVLSEFHICNCSQCRDIAYYDYVSGKYTLWSGMTALDAQPDESYLKEIRRLCDLRFNLYKMGLTISDYFQEYYAATTENVLPNQKVAALALIFNNLASINQIEQFHTFASKSNSFENHLPGIYFTWSLPQELFSVEQEYVEYLKQIETEDGMMQRLIAVLESILENGSQPDLSDLNPEYNSYYDGETFVELSYNVQCKSYTCFGYTTIDGYDCSDMGGIAFGQQYYGYSFAITEGVIKYTGAYDFDAPLDFGFFSPLSVFSPHFHYNILQGYAKGHIDCNPPFCEEYEIFDSCWPLEIVTEPDKLIGSSIVGGISVQEVISKAELHAGNEHLSLNYICKAQECSIQVPCEPEGRLVVEVRGQLFEVIGQLKECHFIKSNACIRFIGKIFCSIDFIGLFSGEILVVGSETIVREPFQNSNHVEIKIDTYFNEYLFVVATSSRMEQFSLKFDDIPMKPSPFIELEQIPDVVAITATIETDEMQTSDLSHLTDEELQQITSLTFMIVMVGAIGLFIIFWTILVLQCVKSRQMLKNNNNNQLTIPQTGILVGPHPSLQQTIYPGQPQCME